MKILPVSDIHTEFLGQWRTEQLVDNLADADVVVIAGDLGTGKGLEHAIATFCRKYPHVVFVPGNHEYYGSSFPQTDELLKEINDKYDNFHWLNSSDGPIEIMGHRFVGDTLWFRRPEWVDEPGAELINDFSQIKSFREFVYTFNNAALRFFQESLKKRDIAVSHHLPSRLSVSEIYQTQLTTEFFVCEMDELILNRKPALWIHGHTHDSFDYMLGETRIVCNPLGYFPHESAGSDFNYNKVIDI